MGPLTYLADPQNPVLPDPTELILGAIAFAIVFFFLYKKMLPNIKKLLEERTEAIEGGLQKAELAQEEAERIKADFTAKLAASRHEADEDPADRLTHGPFPGAGGALSSFVVFGAEEPTDAAAQCLVHRRLGR